MYFTRAPIRALARIKLPYSRGAKRVKMVLKKTGRDAYQLGHPCLLKTNTNKNFACLSNLADYVGCALFRGKYHLHFSERSIYIYHLHISASATSINSIFQRAWHNISLVYFSERSIYHLYISASATTINSIFQRA